ncbi:MAG: glycoside hydrolase family protein [Armatimonadota bacterium]
MIRYALIIFILTIGQLCAQPVTPDWQADIGQVNVKVFKVQSEEPVTTSSYDWGACVMKDGDLYRMWWTRPNPPIDKTMTFEGTDDKGDPFKYDYTLVGDRIFYAESSDGYRWNLNGTGTEISIDSYKPDSPHPIMVLAPSETRWERKHIADPTVVKVNGTFYLYYETSGEFAPREGTTPIEYNCSVYLATSTDGRNWTKWPNNRNPQPVVRVPAENLKPENRRYGFGQPSVCYKDGRFILHYVDSCTWWPDTMVRLESPDPTFRRDVKRITGLRNDMSSGKPVPESAVCKYANTDICWYGDSFYLVRPVFGTDRLAILRSDTGVFRSDDLSNKPLDSPSQIALHDPRGPEFRARYYPKFLRGPHGELIGDGRHMSVFYGAGQDGPGWTAYTWDIHRADLTFPKPLAREKPSSGK